jgi:PAS domain S-box-containing protein
MGSAVPAKQKSSLCNDAGKITGADIATADLASIKLAEKALRESEERYRNLVKYASAGIYEVDFTTGHFTEVNDVMCRILGYTRDELLAKTAFDILDDEGKASFASRIRLAQAGEQPAANIEYRVRKKDGDFIWGLLNVTFHWSGGKIVGAAVIANDITERKRVQEALRESEESYRTLVESSNSIIMRADKNLTITYTNLRSR